MTSKQRKHLPRLGPDLLAARRIAKLTQADLAKRAGLSRAAVLQVESGRGRLDTLVRLAGQINMLVGGKGLPPGDGGIGERLAALRTTRGYSRRAAAALAGISIPTAAAIEAGAATVLVAAVEKLAAVVGATLRLVPVGAEATEWFRSSAYNAWTTPQDLAQVLADAVGGRFDIDAASPGAKKSPIPARRHFTAAMDGLAQPWNGVVWANPPYGRGIGDWTAKAVAEVACGHATMVVALLAANTDTSYWHNDIENRAQYRRFLRGRLRFGGSTNSAPFGSAVVVWGGDDSARHRIDVALTRWEGGRNARRAA
jgi:transcriptional regulator with XRE-family HTH domain